MMHYICPACKGLGRDYDILDDWPHTPEGVARWQTCETCKGEGVVEGKAEVEVEDPSE